MSVDSDPGPGQQTLAPAATATGCSDWDTLWPQHHPAFRAPPGPACPVAQGSGLGAPGFELLSPLTPGPEPRHPTGLAARAWCGETGVTDGMALSHLEKQDSFASSEGGMRPEGVERV